MNSDQTAPNRAVISGSILCVIETSKVNKLTTIVLNGGRRGEVNSL